MGIKWMIKKSDYYEIKKSVSNNNLEALKKEVIEILKKKENQEYKKAIEHFEQDDLRYSHLEKSLNGKWIEKAGYGVGTVRIWKGKKYKKVSTSPVKWVRVFDKEDRGAKSSMTRLIHKVEACNSVEELYQFCMSNHALFKDENGVDLPIMDKLKAAIDNKQNKLNESENLNTKIENYLKEEKQKKDKELNISDSEINSLTDIDYLKDLQKKVVKENNRLHSEKKYDEANDMARRNYVISDRIKQLENEATKKEPEKESELKNNSNMSKRAKNKDRFVADVKNQLERQIELMDNDSKIKAMENLINREGKRSYNGIAAQQIIDELKNKTDMKSQINNMISESVNNNLTEKEFGDLLIDKFPAMKADVYNRAIKDYKQKLEESESEKKLAKEREEKIASAGDYSKVKVENTTSFENKKAIASAVVDSEGKTITIPANKNLANEIKQMKEVAEIGKVRSFNRLNYIGVRDGYLVATNGRSLRRIKVDGLPEDLQGAYDIESEGNNLVLKKKNYDMNIPYYQKVFPSKNDSHFELDNKETINAIKDLKKINYFKETRHKLKITLNKNGVFIGSRKIGSGFDGEERNIVINPNLLISGLTNGPSSTISFDDDSATDGYIMRALGISTNVGDSLVMPLNGGEVPNPDEYAKEHNERNQNLKNSIMESFKTDLQHERMKDVSDGLKSKAMDFMSSLDTKNGYEAKNEIITALPLIHKLLTEDRFKDMGLKPEFGRVDDSKYVSFRDKNGDSFRVSQFDNPRIAKFIKQLAADGEFGNVRKSYFDDDYFEKSFIYDQPSMFSTYETVKNIIDALHENR